MSYLQIGRLVIAPPLQWYEAMGDPMTNLGGAAIPAPRQALRHQIDISTLAADGYSDTLADRLRIRRQLRSMLNNTPLKIQGFYYLIYSDDPEQNGWYMPDFGQMQDIEAAAGLATGVWKLSQVAWIMAGHRRINREARNIWMKDLRTGLFYRDFVKAVYSTDFAALPALQLSVLPPGATSIANAVNGKVPTLATLPAGRGGGSCQLATGLVDLACVAFDRLDSSWGLGDVILYDRRGANDAPTTGPGPTWEEIYGPDYHYSWSSATPTTLDVPILDNGLVRIRYDSTNTPGFKIDVWNGSSYVEQGKLVTYRLGSLNGYNDTLLSASVMEYTMDRAVVQAVFTRIADPNSREKVFITLQRGEMWATFEYYAAPNSNGTTADGLLAWQPALQSGTVSLAASIMKADSQVIPVAVGSGKILSSLSGSSTWSSVPVGNSTFGSSENYMALLATTNNIDTAAAYQHNLTVLQAATASGYGGTDSVGYGLVNYLAYVYGTGQGYANLGIGFTPAQAQQILTAHNMTLGTGTSSTADATAADGTLTTSTRTADAIHVSQATWPNGFQGTYRLFARVKTTSGQGNIYAKTGATTGATRTFAGGTTPSQLWVDLGEIVANNTTLEIHAWNSSAGTISVDRIEAFLITDRARAGAIYSGARDMGQAALYDSRTMGAVVAR